MRYLKRFTEIFERSLSDVYGKNNFVELTPDEIKEWSSELVELVRTAYGNIGGAGAEFESPENLLKSDVNIWYAADVDEDPEIDAGIGAKKTPSGTKIIVIGQDGSEVGKKSVIIKAINLMKNQGFYTEMDPDLAKRMRLDYIKDENIINKVIGSKHQLMMNPDGSYDRYIKGKGKTVTKVLVGMPNIN